MATARTSATKRRAADAAAGNGDAKGDERALEELLNALTKAADGDFSVRLRGRRSDVIGDLQRAVNTVLERNAAMSREMGRVARVVGREGRMTERATMGNVEGGWAEGIDAVNSLVDDLIRPSS